MNLLARRKQLLDAHLAGAVPLDLLKEQDVIARRLTWLDGQISAGKEIYDAAKAHLIDVLDLAASAYDLYMSLDDNPRRICNQAFFEKIYITDDDTITSQPNQGFAMVLHQGVQEATVRADLPGDARGLDRPRQNLLGSRRIAPEGVCGSYNWKASAANE